MRARVALSAVQFRSGITAMKQRFDDMLLHHVSRYAEPHCDLAIGKAMNSTEDEDFLAPLRQSTDFLCHHGQMLSPRDDLFLVRAVTGNLKPGFQRNQ